MTGTSKAKSGKLFENEFKVSLDVFAKNHVIWYRRIQDYRDWISVSSRLRKRRVPGDFEALYMGKYYLFELKSSRGKYFRFSWLKEHQREALLQVEKCGGYGYLVFSKRRGRGSPVDGRAMRICEYLELEEKFRDIGRKSVDVESMLEAGIGLPRVRSRFDLSPIFESKKMIMRQTKLN